MINIIQYNFIYNEVKKTVLFNENLKKIMQLILTINLQAGNKLILEIE